MLTGRPALASVRLCFICLLAMTPQSAARCSVDVTKNVGTLLNDTGLNSLDCRLYTPDIEHFQQKCPSSTMKCFADELKVLTEEWDNFPYGYLRLSIKLKILSKRLNQTESECLQCEVFKEKTAQEFLKVLISTLEEMNSMNCPHKKNRRSSSLTFHMT